MHLLMAIVCSEKILKEQKTKVKTRQIKLPNPCSTDLRPDLATLELNVILTITEVTVCSSLCSIGLNIPLSYRLGTLDV